jgi:hypothetical protein
MTVTGLLFAGGRGGDRYATRDPRIEQGAHRTREATMREQGLVPGEDYRQGYRDALGMVVRGILGVDADTIDIGELIVALSRYEEAVEDWRAAGGEVAPPTWRPTAAELGGETE